LPKRDDDATLSVVRRAVAEQVFFALSALVVVFGCKASVEGDVKTGKTDEIADFDKPMDPKAFVGDRAPEGNAPQTTLLGARQDLAMKGATSAKCKCWR